MALALISAFTFILSRMGLIKLKKLLFLGEKYDRSMTEVFYKSGLKGENNYLEGSFIKQCLCESNKTKKGLILDPFAGAGTTGLVAKENNRAAILIELNGEYLAMAKKRIETVLI